MCRALRRRVLARTTRRRNGPPGWATVRIVLLILIAGPVHLSLAAPTSPASPSSTTSGPTFLTQSFRTNVNEYVLGRVPLYGKFELAFQIGSSVATNPYFPFDADPPPGIEAGTGISVDALLLAPGETDWARARTVPCFVYQPVREVGAGASAALLPTGEPDWRCRFAPDRVGTWRYRVRATDASGTAESAEEQFDSAPSASKGYVRVSDRDPRFFETSDGTPFVTPLINVEQGSPFNTLASIRETIPLMGDGGIRFLRWFPTGEGANVSLASFADTIRINWVFGDGWTTSEGADTAAGKLYSYAPYYYSSQTLPVIPNTTYRLTFRAQVEGDRVLRPQLGSLLGGTLDICSPTGTYHQTHGGTCTVRADGWQDYVLQVQTGPTDTSLNVGVRGLYVSADAPAPYNSAQGGSVLVHSLVLQRDESGDGDWGPNLLLRSDPDSHVYVDARAAALLDEVMRLSEQHGVYHKLTLFHKNDALLARFLPDGSVGTWDIDNFYAADGLAARWYQEAYARYFVARWSYSTALHSLELANENNFDAAAQDAAFTIARVVRDLSPRHILMSNSFWGWWVESFWTDPVRGDLMDYSDKHWYANESGSSCDATGEACELISNVWDDSAAYVRECTLRFDEYRHAFGYDKPIVRGEGGVAVAATGPQHPLIAKDTAGIYYHKKLWAHVGTLGSTCDGEWYPNLAAEYTLGGESYDLYAMLAAYESFVEGEALSNGRFVEIGTDLTEGQRIAISQTSGALRAWGTQDQLTDRTLLWIDNANHTWARVASGGTVLAASGVLSLPGFVPGQAYQVEWWDPYATALTRRPVVTLTFATARADGTLLLSVDGLTRDVALKVSGTNPHRCFLPAVMR